MAKVAKSRTRGAKPGERRGGRKKGTPNKATASIREAAQRYTEEALLVLADVMKDEEQPAAARVSAVKEIFDRGFGKATQAVDVTGDMKFAGLEVVIREQPSD